MKTIVLVTKDVESLGFSYVTIENTRVWPVCETVCLLGDYSKFHSLGCRGETILLRCICGLCDIIHAIYMAFSIRETIFDGEPFCSFCRVEWSLRRMPCKKTFHDYAYTAYVFMQLQVTKVVDVLINGN